MSRILSNLIRKLLGKANHRAVIFPFVLPITTLLRLRDQAVHEVILPVVRSNYDTHGSNYHSYFKSESRVYGPVYVDATAHRLTGRDRSRAIQVWLSLRSNTNIPNYSDTNNANTDLLRPYTSSSRLFSNSDVTICCNSSFWPCHHCTSKYITITVSLVRCHSCWRGWVNDEGRRQIPTTMFLTIITVQQLTCVAHPASLPILLTRQGRNGNEYV